MVYFAGCFWCYAFYQLNHSFVQQSGSSHVHRNRFRASFLILERTLVFSWYVDLLPHLLASLQNYVETRPLFCRSLTSDAVMKSTVAEDFSRLPKGHKDKHLSAVRAREGPQVAFRSHRAQVHLLSWSWNSTRSADLPQAKLWRAFSPHICHRGIAPNMI